MTWMLDNKTLKMYQAHSTSTHMPECRNRRGFFFLPELQYYGNLNEIYRNWDSFRRKMFKARRVHLCLVNLHEMHPTTASDCSIADGLAECV